MLADKARLRDMRANARSYFDAHLTERSEFLAVVADLPGCPGLGRAVAIESRRHAAIDLADDLAPFSVLAMVARAHAGPPFVETFPPAGRQENVRYTLHADAEVTAGVKLAELKASRSFVRRMVSRDVPVTDRGNVDHVGDAAMGSNDTSSHTFMTFNLVRRGSKLFRFVAGLVGAAGGTQAAGRVEQSAVR